MGEQNCLISNMLASECLLLLIGVLGSMAASGVVSGDWFGSIVGLGWGLASAIRAWARRRVLRYASRGQSPKRAARTQRSVEQLRRS